MRTMLKALLKPIVIMGALLTCGMMERAGSQPMNGGMMNPGMAMPQFQFDAAKPVDTVLSQSRHGKLTIGDIQNYAASNYLFMLRGVPPTRIPELTSETLRRAAEFITARQEAATLVEKSTDTQFIEQLSKELDNTKIREISAILSKEWITDRATTPTQEQISEYYEKHKPDFYQPFQFRMRHLILLTYQPYVVRPGDTLEDIALRVGGDGVTSASIRADVPGRTPRYEDGVEFKPLVEGEKLLVPMRPDQVAQVKARLGEILKQLDEKTTGSTFADLAAKFSEAEVKGEVIGPLPSGTRPILQEMLEAAKKTPVGGVSDIFVTKHGVQAIQVVEKIEEGQKTLDQVRGEIIQALRNAENQKNVDELLKMLIAQPAFKVDIEKFKHADTLTSETPVITVGDEKIKFDYVDRLWRQRGAPTDEAGIKDALRTVIQVQLALIREWARPLLENPESELSRKLSSAKVLLYGGAYIDRTAASELNAQLTDERIKQYYDQHQSEFQAPERVRFVTLEQRLSAQEQTLPEAEKRAALEKLTTATANLVADIKSINDFENRAAQINETLDKESVPPLQAIEKPLALDYLPSKFVATLKSLQPGSISKPFITDSDNVAVIGLIERLPAGTKSIEEVREEIRMQLQRELSRDLGPQRDDRYLKQAQFSWVYSTGK